MATSNGSIWRRWQLVLEAIVGCLGGGSYWLHLQSSTEVAIVVVLCGSLGPAARSGGWQQLLGWCMLVGGDRWEERTSNKEKKKMSKCMFC